MFVYDAKGMIHADYWTQASGWEYPQGAIMSPYIGSQDTARFVTARELPRARRVAFDEHPLPNRWDSIAGPPPRCRAATSDSSWRSRGSSPCRARRCFTTATNMANTGALTQTTASCGKATDLCRPDETTTLAHMQALGQARKELVALRRGICARDPYDRDHARPSPGETTASRLSALVALSALTTMTTFTVALPIALPVANGAIPP